VSSRYTPDTDMPAVRIGLSRLSVFSWSRKASTFAR
jgi:hypothetical protein